MLTYIGKRILVFIPTLFVITLLGFIIAVSAPGDPVEKMVTAASSTGEIGKQSISQQEQRLFWRKKLGLDLPIFYFSISSISIPDTLYKIYDENENKALSRLIDKYGNWKEISSYYLSCASFYNDVVNTSIDTTGLTEFEKNKLYDDFVQLKFESQALKSAYTDESIKAKFDFIKGVLSKNTNFKKLVSSFNKLQDCYNYISINSSIWKNYIPSINFYGTKNQYHRWLFGDGEFSKGIIRFDFGISYVSKQPVSEIIGDKISWSLFFSLSSVFLAFIISIPLGVKSAQKRGGVFDRTSSLILFMLYSLPAFFVAFLLMLFFSNPNFLSLLPSSGVKPVEGYPDGSSFLECVKLSLPYIVLPLICYTYSSFAFLSRTVRGSMLEVLEQDYIRTARAKGLNEKKILWKHAFKNSLFPLITVFANIFPLAIGGSVILESIFTIPGMGLELYNAIASQNYPIIIAVMTLTGLLTLVGFLVSDLLYVIVDPRVRLK